MIKLENLQKVYENGFTAITDISFTLPDKGLIGIIGESGSGKTTLINCIYGSESYDGNIYIDGEIVTKDNREIIRKEKMSMIYQDYQLIEDLTVADNLIMAKDCVGQGFRNEDLIESIKQVGLEEDFFNKKCKKLSGGEKQRVAIARTISQGAKIILADEPTGNLDDKNARAIFEIFKQLSKQVLVIIVTHNEEYAKEYSDYIIELDGGEISNNEIINYESSVVKDKTHIRNLRRTKLSGRTFYNLFKIFFSNKIMVVLSSFFAIILMLTSMLMFGFADVNENNVVSKNLLHNPEHTMLVTTADDIDIKIIENENVSFEYYLSTAISYLGDNSIEVIKDDLPIFYSKTPFSNSVVECQDIKQIGGQLLIGKDPRNCNEIAINEYIARWMIASKMKYNGKRINKLEDILGVTIKNGLKVVGVIDAGIYEKIKLFNLKREDYLYKEINDLDYEEKEKVYACFDMIFNNVESNITTVGYGYAKSVNNENNCRSIYMSSKLFNAKSIINKIQKQQRYDVKLQSLYTYRLDNVINFYTKNHTLFLITAIITAIISVIFALVTEYLLLNYKANDILIMRMLGMDRNKLMLPIILAQMLLFILQIALSVIGCFAINAIMNINIAKNMIVAFKTLFFAWDKVAILLGTIGISILSFLGLYINNKFTKTINLEKRKEIK